MTPDAVLHPLPRARALVAEQFRAVGIALRREWILYLLGLAFLTLIFTLNELREGRNPNLRNAFSLTPTTLQPITLLGLFAPMSVWKGEGPGRRGYHWSMPVGRVQHTLTKCLAGWGWLMLLLAVFIVWGAVMARATGGTVGVTEYQVVASQPALVGIFQRVVHRMEPWQWIVPFTAITIAYLVGSVIVLVSDHPWIWLGGIVVGLYVVGVTMSAAGLDEALRSISSLVDGRFGLATTFTGVRKVTTEVLFRGEMVRARNGVPDASAWLLATLIWMGAAAAGALWAANRHPEE